MKKKETVVLILSAALLFGSVSDAHTDGRRLGAIEARQVLKMAMAEAEGEDVQGKALVIRVILNRVGSGDFPDTVTDVLYQPGAFESMDNGRYDGAEPDPACYDALDMVQAEKWDGSMGATYFENGGGEWHAGNLRYLFTHGNHNFYKGW